MKKPVPIVVFASGQGTNAVNIIRYFHAGHEVRVVRIYCNHAGAGVISRAAELDVPVTIFDREMMKGGGLLEDLRQQDPGLLVLAGFLWLLPPDIVNTYKDRILNIHPALLPSYGGKGMYGERVHQAVIADKAKQSGITVHLVNEHYDEGAILFQAECPVLKDDTPEMLAGRIHELEYRHYPRVIRSYIGQLGL